MNASEPSRLRTPPRERFTGDTKSFDLERIFERLATEEYPPIDGHHQITLFKSGTSTVMAFVFDTDGYLPQHQADGVVTLQVVDGRLEVDTPEERLAVGAGGLLVIRPGIPHEVHASEPSQMVMTVYLRNPATKEQG